MSNPRYTGSFKLKNYRQPTEREVRRTLRRWRREAILKRLTFGWYDPS